jgi:ABC-type dipeptide/oligopeptide/nickel transport system permease subunit
MKSLVIITWVSGFANAVLLLEVLSHLGEGGLPPAPTASLIISSGTVILTSVLTGVRVAQYER